MPDSSNAVAAMVTLRLVYLARLRDAFGKGGETLGLADAAPTVARLLVVLRARGDRWSEELADARAVRVAVNHAIVVPATILHDGDEVAFLPPVTGG